MREWYSLDSSVTILERFTDDHPIPVAELGNPNAQSDLGLADYLLVMHENQYVSCWAVLLNGQDDPPVSVEVANSGQAWQPFADTFSAFVYTVVTDWKYDLMLCATDDALAESDLQLLRANFVEGHATYNWPARRTYRFTKPEQQIVIWAGDDQADWHVQASCPEQLEEVARAVWQCGALRETLFEVEPYGEDILAALRGST